MSQFPRSQIPQGGAPIPQESPLNLPFVQADQRNDVGVSPWTQLSTVLRGVGQTIAGVADVQSEMNIARARQILLDRRVDMDTRETEDRKREAEIRRELAEARVLYANNPKGLANAIAPKLEKVSDSDRLSTIVLSELAQARSETAQMDERSQEVKLNAQRLAVVSDLVGRSKDALIKNQQDFDSAANDAPAFKDSLRRNIMAQLSEAGLLTDEEERAKAFLTVTSEIESKFDNDLQTNLTNRQKRVMAAEISETVNRIGDSITPETVQESGLAIISEFSRTAPSESVARIEAGRVVEDAISRYSVPGSPVTTYSDRIRMANELATSDWYSGNAAALAESYRSAFRTEASELARATVGRLAGGIQERSFAVFGRPITEETALALRASDDPNMVDSLVDSVIPQSDLPEVMIERENLRAGITERVNRGRIELDRLRVEVSDEEIELSKVRGGVFGADYEKAYKASSLWQLMNGHPEASTPEFQTKAAQDAALFFNGTVPNAMTEDLANGLRSTNPKAVQWTLNILKAVPPGVSGSAFTQLSGIDGKNADVSIAAKATLLMSQSGRVVDEVDFFNQYRQALGTYAEFVSRGDINNRSQLPIEQELYKAVVGGTEAVGAISKEDQFDPASAALLRSLVAFKLQLPISQEMNRADVINNTVAEVGAWGLKFVRNGKTISLVKDVHNHLPDWMVDSEKVRTAAMSWVEQNQDEILRVLDNNRIRRAERESIAEGVPFEQKLRSLDRSYASGDRLNPDFMSRMDFFPITDSLQLQMPRGSAGAGVPFRIFVDGQQIDTFNDSPFSSVVIPDMNQEYRRATARYSLDLNLIDGLRRLTNETPLGVWTGVRFLPPPVENTNTFVVRTQ
jgi:hypothetical protein